MYLEIYTTFALVLLGLTEGSGIQTNFQDQATQILSTLITDLVDLPSPQVLGRVADPEAIEAILAKLNSATHSLYISKVIRNQLEFRSKRITTRTITPCHQIVELCLGKLKRQDGEQEDTFWKCIQILVREGDIEMVKIFHRAGYIVDDTEFLRLGGIASNRKDLIDFFLENGKSLIDFELTVILMLQSHEIDPKMFEYFVSKGLPSRLKRRSFNFLEESMIRGNLVMAYYFYKSGFSLCMLDNIQMDICKSKFRPEDLVKFMAFKEKMFWIYQALEDEGSTFYAFPDDIVTSTISALLLDCGSMEINEASWLSALKCPDLRPDLFTALVGTTKVTYPEVNWFELALRSGRFDLGKTINNL